MTPANFWGTFMSNIVSFYNNIYTKVFLPMINVIINTPILLLVFGFMILSYVISFYGKLK